MPEPSIKFLTANERRLKYIHRELDILEHNRSEADIFPEENSTIRVHSHRVYGIRTILEENGYTVKYISENFFDISY